MPESGAKEKTRPRYCPQETHSQVRRETRKRSPLEQRDVCCSHGVCRVQGAPCQSGNEVSFDLLIWKDE